MIAQTVQGGCGKDKRCFLLRKGFSENLARTGPEWNEVLLEGKTLPDHLLPDKRVAVELEGLT
jgi:hypothetical protein